MSVLYIKSYFCIKKMYFLFQEYSQLDTLPASRLLDRPLLDSLAAVKQDDMLEPVREGETTKNSGKIHSESNTFQNNRIIFILLAC